MSGQTTKKKGKKEQAKSKDKKNEAYGQLDNPEIEDVIEEAEQVQEDVRPERGGCGCGW